jgi:hypothetical protein
MAKKFKINCSVCDKELGEVENFDIMKNEDEKIIEIGKAKIECEECRKTRFERKVQRMKKRYENSIYFAYDNPWRHLFEDD